MIWLYFTLFSFLKTLFRVTVSFSSTLKCTWDLVINNTGIIQIIQRGNLGSYSDDKNSRSHTILRYGFRQADLLFGDLLLFL